MRKLLFMLFIGGIVVAYNGCSGGTGTGGPLTEEKEPGSLDTTWATNGKLVQQLPSTIYVQNEGGGLAIAVQSTQKIVVGGGDSGNAILVRHNQDGSVDTTFATSGKLTFGNHCGGYFGISSLAIDSSDRILATAFACHGIALIRITADGAIDTSFNASGAHPGFIYEDPSPNSTANNILYGGKRIGVNIVTGNNILVSTTSFGPDGGDIIFYRYDSDGDDDAAFGTAGSVMRDLGRNSEDILADIKIAADGRIVIVGWNEDSGDADFMVARFMSDGSLDPSFGSGGAVFDYYGSTFMPPAQDGTAQYLHGLALNSDNSVVVTGNIHAAGTSTEFVVAKYESDGDVDTTFGDQGYYRTTLITVETGERVHIQSDGKIIVSGRIGPNFATSSELFVTRLSADGALDTSFGASGVTLVTPPDSQSEIFEFSHDLTVQSDGRILVLSALDTPANNPPSNRVHGYIVGRLWP